MTGPLTLFLACFSVILFTFNPK